MEKKDIQVVMLAAGKGQRFKEANYRQPKPLIPLKNGKPMFEHVMDMYRLTDDHSKVYVYTPHFGVLTHDSVKLLKAVELPYGPADSALRAVSLLAAHESVSIAGGFDMMKPVLFLDCDSFAECDVRQLVAQAIGRGVDTGKPLVAGALVFDPAQSRKKHFSRVIANRYDNTLVSSMLEHESPNLKADWAGAGGYFFTSGYILLHYASSIIRLLRSESASHTREAHLSNVLNRIAGDGHRVGIVQVPNFTCMGTPDELKEYEETL